MISRIDHVSIAVRDAQKAYDFFQNVLGAVPGYGAEDVALKFFWRVFSLGDLSRLEIIEPTSEGGLLDGFLRRKAGGVHHITLQTPDISEARRTLETHGIPYFGANEYDAYYWKEIFIHPKDAFGVLIQIAEFNPDDWLSSTVRPAPGKKWQVRKSDKGAVVEWAHPGGGCMEAELDASEIQALITDLQRALAP